METSTSKPISEPMGRVLDALFEGQPIPSDAQAALTEEERTEVASLARTAHLTSLTLNQPDPTDTQEQTARQKATDALANLPKSGPEKPESQGSWWSRWFQKKED